MDSLVKSTLAVPIDLLGLRKFTQASILNMYPSQVEGFSFAPMHSLKNPKPLEKQRI